MMEYLKIIKKLQENNFEAYTVGGCVRDRVMGLDPDDFDITTSATPDEIIKLFKNENVKQVGKTFGVIIVNDIEVATYRFDNYSGNDLNVTFADNVFDDLARRDLTINALAFDDINEEVFGNEYGLSDINNKIIRFVGKPIERIKEDPCRILRACRFLAKIDGEFDELTLKGLKWGVQTDRIKEIAPERIRLEILKAMKIKKAYKFFEALHNIGALKLIFPSLDSCWDHEHGNHHIENVWDHNMLAGDSIQLHDPILKLAGYLHDCGKPAAFNPETGQFLKHEIEGAISAKRELNTLKFTKKEIQKVYGLIRSHMYSIQKMTPKAVRRFLKRLDDRNVELSDFLRIRIADRNANLAHENFTLSEYKDMIKRVTHPEVNIPFSVNKLALKGGELIKEFNLTPGPIVSELQNYLLNFVIERGPAHNNKQLLKVVANRFLED